MSDDAPAARPAVRWIVVAVVAVAVIAVAFAIGRFTAFGATAAPAHPSDTSADAGFARDMQVHHTQAVLMAMEIYRKTDDDELRTLSYDIATTQSGQRGEMYGWLVEWGLPQASDQPLMTWMESSGEHSHGDTAALTTEQLMAEMGMASDAELDELRTLEGRPADCLFLSLMIRHHQGAIPMAQAVIELGEDARVEEVAGTIVSGQSAEIDAMRDIQSRLGCSA
ncbi:MULTISPECIES: DUF305 domain-containing protein [Microbacterium]|uniref:DUF305 domain-containing protein n=1 Tax=Microbacterium TaxID=33882 RepID=UPI00277DD2F7|nr:MULTISPECIES: DUF305 domain-containing protein [Microbacterium]MDQ1084919.1 uncharacterized protein (DUF305 family) [Microbacterium sp. SORGH_AS_0344]MDQ1169803.1 uncharacterized protein (DUF305 family) [Microbacterium proteolyticum]